MDKNTEYLWIGGGVLAVIGALVFAGRSSSSSGGFAVSAPSDASVAAIEQGQAAASAAATSAGVAKTQALASTVLGIAQAQSATTIAGVQANAATTQVQAATQGALAQSEVQSSAAVSADEVLAKANEIIQGLVTQQANYATLVAGETSVTAVNAGVRVAQAQGTAAASAAASQAAAALQASQNQLAAANHASDNSLWGQIVGGIASVVPFFKGAPASSTSSFVTPANAADYAAAVAPVPLTSIKVPDMQLPSIPSLIAQVGL